YAAHLPPRGCGSSRRIWATSPRGSGTARSATIRTSLTRRPGTSSPRHHHREGGLAGRADDDEDAAILPPARAVLARAVQLRQRTMALDGHRPRAVDP